MKVKNIGRIELQMIGARVKAALKDLESELGVTFAYQGGTYGVGSSLKLGIEVQDAGNGKSSAQVQFEAHAAYLGLKPEWFGVPFNARGERYKIVGVNPGRPKNVLSIMNVHTGKIYVCGKDFVRPGLEIEVATGRLVA